VNQQLLVSLLADLTIAQCMN